jgi:hypothetical protein
MLFLFRRERQKDGETGLGRKEFKRDAWRWKVEGKMGERD